MPKEFKVVIVLKDGHGMVGIQSPECDPILTPIEGDIVAIAADLPSLIAKAETQWSQAPKMPASSIKPPPPPTPVVSASKSATKKEPVATETQPTWFP